MSSTSMFYYLAQINTQLYNQQYYIIGVIHILTDNLLAAPLISMYSNGQFSEFLTITREGK